MRGLQDGAGQDGAGAVNFWTGAHARERCRDVSGQQPLLRAVPGGGQPAGGILVGAVGGEGVE